MVSLADLNDRDGESETYSSFPFLVLYDILFFGVFAFLLISSFIVYLRSIPVIQKYCQLNKKEPQGKIELHLGGCKQNNHKPEVQNEFNTE